MKYCYDLEIAQLEILRRLELTNKYFSVFPKQSLTKMFLGSVLPNIGSLSSDATEKFNKSSLELSNKCEVQVTMDDMISAAVNRAAIPLMFEKGAQVITDAMPSNSQDPVLLGILTLLAELRSDMESNKPVSPEKKQNFMDKLGRYVGYGKNVEQVTEWGGEFAQALEQAAPFIGG